MARIVGSHFETANQLLIRMPMMKTTNGWSMAAVKRPRMTSVICEVLLWLGGCLDRPEGRLLASTNRATTRKQYRHELAYEPKAKHRCAEGVCRIPRVPHLSPIGRRILGRPIVDHVDVDRNVVHQSRKRPNDRTDQ